MQTWDPTEFSIEIGGNTAESFADGTFIKAGFNEDRFSIKVGADGVAVRVRNANNSGRFELTLLSSSPTNDKLAALSLLDQQTGKGVVPVAITDGSGTAVASAAKAWVVKQGDIERGKELTEVTWIIETGNLVMQQGGMTDS